MTHSQLSREGPVERLGPPEQRPDCSPLRDEGAASDREQLIQELRLHQIELETQNLALREAQGSLEASLGRYADLYDFAPVAYVTVNRAGMILEINLTGAAMLGQERDRLLGRPLLAATDVGEAKALFALIRRSLTAETPVVAELTFSTSRGRLDVQAVAARVAGGPGQRSACRLAFIDVSTSKRSDPRAQLGMLADRMAVALEVAQLRQVEHRERARLQFLIEAAPQLGEANDLDTALSVVARLVVPALADLCSVELLGADGALTLLEAYHDDAAKQALLDPLVGQRTTAPFPEIVRAAIGRGQAQLRRMSPEYLARESPPEIVQHARACMPRVIVAPLLLQGRPIGHLTLALTESDRRFHDDDLYLVQQIARHLALAIERSRLYRSTQYAIDARDSVLAIVAHDLRSPLHVIRLTAHAMSEGVAAGVLPSRAGEPAEIIGDAARRLDRLIEALCDASSIERGELSVAPSAEDASALVRDACRLLLADADARLLSLRVNVPDHLPVVLCDRQRVFQVVTNLVDNAMKFTPAQGEVRVEASVVGTAVRICVEDSGRGIAPADLPHVFDRYWRADLAGRQGTGLGLFIARGIIRAHGGELWAESDEGRGSKFFFTLPLAPATAVGPIIG
jgi:PAS domain S-box-containing protein